MAFTILDDIDEEPVDNMEEGWPEQNPIDDYNQEIDRVAGGLWKQGDGKLIAIKKMGYVHCVNAMRYLRKNPARFHLRQTWEGIFMKEIARRRLKWGPDWASLVLTERTLMACIDDRPTTKVSPEGYVTVTMPEPATPLTPLTVKDGEVVTVTTSSTGTATARWPEDYISTAKWYTAGSTTDG